MNTIQRITDVQPFQKPQDSVFSMLFTRKVSRVLTFFMVKYIPRITPNQVSVFSFVLAVAAVILFMQQEWLWRAGGAVLLQLSFAFDCSDGEVSRIKNMSSKYGAWLDSTLDRFKEVLMLGSMTWYWYTFEQTEVQVLLVGFAAIVGLQLVSYLREAKKASWPSSRTSEVFIAKNMYIGTVDVTVYLVTVAVLLNLELLALWIFFLVSIPLLLKQLRSAYKLRSQP